MKDKDINNQKNDKFKIIMNKILPIIYKWLYAPVLILCGMLFFATTIKNNALKNIATWLIGVFVVAYIVIITIVLIKQLKKNGMLAASIMMFLTALLFSFCNTTKASNFTFVIFGIFLELYLLLCIFYSISKKKEKGFIEIILCSTLFVCIGCLFIYLFTYNLETKDFYNSLMAVFAAIVGGILTLGGVAWTIVNENKKNRDLESRKVRPYLFITQVIDKKQGYLSSTLQVSDNSDNLFLPIEALFVKRNANPKLKFYHLPSLVLKNSDFSNVIIKYVEINKVKYKTAVNYLDKNEYVWLLIDKYIADKDLKINLIVEDLLGKEYIYDVNYNVIKSESHSPYVEFPNITRFTNDNPIEIQHISYLSLKETTTETSKF